MADSSPEEVLESLRSAIGAQYEIQEQLGAGGMGSVFLGRDKTLDRQVAIKVISPDLATSRQFRERFLHEARTVAKLRHPNIVAVYSAGETAGLLYFVMEYVPGESLRALLDREQCCDTARGIAILHNLADALAYAHRNGVIHRDLKPENVLLDRESGLAKLTDFGVARAFASTDERLTGTGLVVGTPRYMSPEQASGERNLDGRSDIYSLGLIGYELFAGEPAFTGTTPASVIVKQMTEPAPPLIEKAKGVPPGVAAAIDRALQKDPAQRWSDASEMARALDDPSLSTPTPISSHTPVRRRKWIAAAALAAIVILSGTAWFLGRQRGGVPEDVDPRKSLLVIPFSNLSGDPELDWLNEGSVSMLTLNLAQWRDLNVVDYERSLDLLRDAELDTVSNISLSDARALARKAGVWTVVTGQIARSPDSLRVVARVYDVASGSRLKQAQLSVPRSADPRTLFDRLSTEVLDLAGAPPLRPELAKTTTSSLDAYRAYLAGVRALNSWELEAADTAFEQALELDSTFALAYYKRALGRGWRQFSDTGYLRYSRQAAQYAGRLLPRERGLIEANLLFAQGNFAGAEERFAAMVARDSADAEAWYGLGDAHFHQGASDWTASLRAFDRTLALDSSFHLAYSHKVLIYQAAGTSGGRLVLLDDSLQTLRNEAEAAALGAQRIKEARKRAQQLAIEDARQWVFADQHAHQSHLALAEAYAAAGNHEAATRTLTQAMEIPTVRTPDIAYRVAQFQLPSEPAKALESLHSALRTYGYDSLRARGSVQSFQIVLSTGSIAGYHGAVDVLEQVFTLAARIAPPFPPTSTVTGADLVQLGYHSMLTSLGAELTPAERRTLSSLLTKLDKAEGPFGRQLRLQGSLFPYSAFVATGDTTFLSMYQRWAGENEIPVALQAYRALALGDTATAVRLSAQFRGVDTTKLLASNAVAFAPFVEAEVLANIGNLRGAVAIYESLDPKDFVIQGLDPRWALYVRSLLARGQLYQQLGERQKAEVAYQRFIELWANAHPRVQPQVRAARAALGQLRDAPPSN